MRELIRELAEMGVEAMTIQSVILFLETDDNFEKMKHWLQEVKNPTKNDILMKAYLISDEN